MTNDELIDQFKRCEEWQDANQWDALGMAYFNRGFMLNAGLCFRRADERRLSVLVAVETLRQAQRDAEVD